MEFHVSCTHKLGEKENVPGLAPGGLHAEGAAGPEAVDRGMVTPVAQERATACRKVISLRNVAT